MYVRNIFYKAKYNVYVAIPNQPIKLDKSDT